MLIPLIGLQFLVGLGVLLAMLVFAFLRRMRRNPAYKVGVIFGISALLISLALTVAAIARNTEAASFSPAFWQAPIPSAWFGRPSDSTSWEELVWGLVIVRNMGLYSGIGFAAGLDLDWAQDRQFISE